MLSQGKAELIDSLKQAQAEKQRLAAAAHEKNEKLAAIQQQQQEQQKLFGIAKARNSRKRKPIFQILPSRR